MKSSNCAGTKFWPHATCYQTHTEENPKLKVETELLPVKGWCPLFHGTGVLPKEWRTLNILPIIEMKRDQGFQPDSLHPQRGSPSKDHFWKVWTHWTHRVSTKESIRLVSHSLFQVSHMFSLIMHKLVAHPSLLSSTPASKPLTELKGTWTLFSASETM